jgi:hypothetical protein
MDFWSSERDDQGNRPSGLTGTYEGPTAGDGNANPAAASVCRRAWMQGLDALGRVSGI